MRSFVLSLLKRPPLTLMTFIAIFLLQGCVDLQAVRNFAKISAATADYHQIVSSYVESPERQKQYQPQRFHPQLEKQSKERSQQKPILEGAQKILVEYMNALGDLAGDKLPNVDSEIDGLGKALEKTKIVGDEKTKKTATAASTIAKVLSKAVLDQWRRNELKKLIIETDDSVKIVLQDLREIMHRDFKNSLDAEAEAIGKYFNESIADAENRGDTIGVPRISRILMNNQLDRISLQRKKLEDYVKVLDKIRQGHADLRENVDNLENKELVNSLKMYSRELETLYNAIREFHS